MQVHKIETETVLEGLEQQALLLYLRLRLLEKICVSSPKTDPAPIVSFALAIPCSSIEADADEMPATLGVCAPDRSCQTAQFGSLRSKVLLLVDLRFEGLHY